jgi:hypothetical protein
MKMAPSSKLKWIGVALLMGGRIPSTLMATLQGAKTFEHQYKAFFILLGVSTFVILIFYVYHEQIHGWIKKSKGKNYV